MSKHEKKYRRLARLWGGFWHYSVQQAIYPIHPDDVPTQVRAAVNAARMAWKYARLTNPARFVEQEAP
jgi:hypothetical protein